MFMLLKKSFPSDKKVHSSDSRACCSNSNVTPPKKVREAEAVFTKHELIFCGRVRFNTYLHICSTRFYYV